MHTARASLRLVPVAIALALASAAADARADEKNPAVEACAGKAEGAPCSAQRPHQDEAGNAVMKSEPGTCQPDQCCALDYSKGSPPVSNCGPCLACKPGAPTPAAEGGGGEGPQTEPPRTENGPPPNEPSKKGCSIAGGGLGGAWLFVLLAVRRRARAS